MKQPASPSLASLIRRIQDLYTLPPVVAHLSRLLSDPSVTAQQVADAISSDVAMAAKVLRLVNSAYYGFSRRIGNLKMAIVILGFREIRKLVMTLGTIRAFGRAGKSLPLKTFWRHCVAVGALAEQILAEKAPSLKDDGFVAGLLHDMGKLVIAQELPMLFNHVRSLAAGGARWVQAERSAFGFDHCEVGGGLAGVWRFPPELTDAIRWHHDSGNCLAERVLVSAVQVADLCVRAALIDLPDSGPLAPVSSKAWETLGLEPDQVERFFVLLPRCLVFVDEILAEVPVSAGA